MRRACLAFSLALSLTSLGYSSDSSSKVADSVRYAKLRDQVRVSALQGGPASLGDALEEAVKLYAQDGDLWWRLGQARLAAKKYDAAIEAYNRALELGAFGNKFKAGALYDLACAYSLKGDKERSFSYLERSLNAGFRDLQHLRTDSDLESLRSDKRWQEIAATKDVSKMTRDEGWRYDLWLMHREVSRIHFNPYGKFTKQEQDAWVKKLSSDIPKMSDNQIKAAFMKYMRRLNDGHTQIRPANAPAIPSLPLQLSWFEEGLIVVAAAPKHAELVGAQLLEVEGKPMDRALKVIDELAAQDNSQGLKAAAPRYLVLPSLLNGLGLVAKDSEVTYKFKLNNGTTKNVVLTPEGSGVKPDWAFARDMKPEAQPMYLKNRDKAFWFEHLPDLKAVYMQYNSVRNEPNETTEAFSKRLFDFIEQNAVERLIVDVRWNGGGNSFLNRPIVNGIIGCKRVNSRGSLFVITGRNTFSAAQNFSTDLDRAVSPIFVGEPTGSSPNFVGESVRFSLPYSKMEGTISDLYWQRSWPMDHRTWIAPDLPAAPSFELFRANRDPAMEAIEAYLKA